VVDPLAESLEFCFFTCFHIASEEGPPLVGDVSNVEDVRVCNPGVEHVTPVMVPISTIHNGGYPNILSLSPRIVETIIGGPPSCIKHPAGCNRHACRKIENQ